MRRVLVAESVGLWIHLNRHLSGVSEVDLVETPTLESGRLLAQLERPSVVVLGRESLLADAESLVRDFERNDWAGTRIVLASESLEASERPFRPNDPSVVICPEEEIPSAVTELLALNEEPDRSLDLLVHYRSDGGTGPSEGFIVVLDLDPKRLLLHSDEELAEGQELVLDFFVPGAPGAHREKVSLSCTVGTARDGSELVYEARVSEIDETAAAAVSRLRRGGVS